MSAKILFEACVDSVESSIAAQEGGADRLELCADLFNGGITPSMGTIELVSKHVKIPIMVMIRSGVGDFCSSDLEFEEMKKNIEYIKQFNVTGVVLGILNVDCSIDLQRTKELIQLARPMEVTFHRAFDLTRDPLEALDQLVKLGVDRILTSGQERNAYDGINMIKKLVKRAGDKIIIMPGGGINEDNAAEIVAKCGVKEIHASARVRKESRMKFWNVESPMDYQQKLSVYGLRVTSAERIRAIKETLQ